jgi:aldose 1-epimerase
MPIKLTWNDQIAVVNELGGGIMRYYLEKNKKTRDIVYGYLNEDEKTGSMGDILFPFPGRVKNSEYNFGGKNYLLSGVRIKDGHAIHGFAKTLPWKVERTTKNSATLCLSLLEDEYKEKGFPFSLKIIIEYSLDDLGLCCKTLVKNIGQKKAPFGLGFHPYFTVGTAFVDDMYLQIPARRMVEFNGLKPTGDSIMLDKTGLNYSNLSKIGDKIIDNCFTDLKFQKGIAKTIISNGNGIEIEIWQDKNLPYLQIYSADTIADEHCRRGLAIEPQTCTGFALNKPEMGLIILDHGEEYTCRWGVSPKL